MFVVMFRTEVDAGQFCAMCGTGLMLRSLKATKENEEVYVNVSDPAQNTELSQSCRLINDPYSCEHCQV